MEERKKRGERDTHKPRVTKFSLDDRTPLHVRIHVSAPGIVGDMPRRFVRRAPAFETVACRGSIGSKQVSASRRVASRSRESEGTTNHNTQTSVTAHPIAVSPYPLYCLAIRTLPSTAYLSPVVRNRIQSKDVYRQEGVRRACVRSARVVFAGPRESAVLLPWRAGQAGYTERTIIAFSSNPCDSSCKAVHNFVTIPKVRPQASKKVGHL